MRGAWYNEGLVWVGMRVGQVWLKSRMEQFMYEDIRYKTHQV